MPKVEEEASTSFKKAEPESFNWFGKRVEQNTETAAPQAPVSSSKFELYSDEDKTVLDLLADSTATNGWDRVKELFKKKTEYGNRGLELEVARIAMVGSFVGGALVAFFIEKAVIARELKTLARQSNIQALRRMQNSTQRTVRMLKAAVVDGTKSSLLASGTCACIGGVTVYRDKFCLWYMAVVGAVAGAVTSVPKQGLGVALARTCTRSLGAYALTCMAFLPVHFWCKQDSITHTYMYLRQKYILETYSNAKKNKELDAICEEKDWRNTLYGRKKAEIIWEERQKKADFENVD